MGLNENRGVRSARASRTSRASQSVFRIGRNLRESAANPDPALSLTTIIAAAGFPSLRGYPQFHLPALTSRGGNPISASNHDCRESRCRIDGPVLGLSRHLWSGRSAEPRLSGLSDRKEDSLRCCRHRVAAQLADCGPGVPLEVAPVAVSSHFFIGNSGHMPICSRLIHAARSASSHHGHFRLSRLRQDHLAQPSPGST